MTGSVPETNDKGWQILNTYKEYAGKSGYIIVQYTKISYIRTASITSDNY